jgi:transposase
MLEPSVQAEILRLFFSEGLSRRKIARQLALDRHTVGQVISRRQVRIGPQQQPARPSLLDAFHTTVQKLLDTAPERSAVNIIQHLRAAGYHGGITILRDYLRSIRPSPRAEAFLDLELAKGEAAQVDWGEFGDVFADGTKVHVFVMVLSWSRMLYIEFTLRETLPAFLRCFERALRFFDGRCREYWFDNMPTVVAERVGRLARLTPRFAAYGGFHGFKAILCGIGKGNEKGRVEDGVKLVRYQFWPGRHFTDLADLNRQASEWRDTFANRREHHTTHQVPELMLPAERPFLIPLRPEPYDTDDLVSCKVSHQFQVRFDSNFYSVPWTMVGKNVTVRADDTSVRIIYKTRIVATHDRCYRRDWKIKNPAHQNGLVENKAAASRTWQVEAVRSFGPHTQRYLDIIQAGTRSLRAEIKELLCMATVYGPQRLEQTIGQLLATGKVGADRIERALRLSTTTETAPEPMHLPDERLHFVPPTPDLRAYDALLLDARNLNHTDGDDET